jgi:hypothetical protein
LDVRPILSPGARAFFCVSGLWVKVKGIDCELSACWF